MRRRFWIESLLHLTARLPLPVVHRIGALIGAVLMWFPNPLRRVAQRNLTLAFPQMPAADRQHLLRKNLQETGKLALELGPLWCADGTKVLSWVRGAVAGETALAAAVQQKQGAILITPHLGAWEMAGLYYSSRHPLTILYRPSRLGLDAISCQGRGRMGGTVVATDANGLRALLAALRRGEVVGILPDQDAGGEGKVFAPFFGVAASTMTLVSRLAIKTGAPVFLTWAERLPRGQGFSLHLQPLPAVNTATSLEISAAIINRAIEDAVRAVPAQYLWVYKRFKTQPPGTPRLY